MILYVEDAGSCAGIDFENAEGVALGLMDADAVSSFNWSESTMDIPAGSRFMGFSMDSIAEAGSASWYAQIAVSDNDWADAVAPIADTADEGEEGEENDGAAVAPVVPVTEGAGEESDRHSCGRAGATSVVMSVSMLFAFTALAH
jgi:hypothetical protein